MNTLKHILNNPESRSDYIMEFDPDSITAADRKTIQEFVSRSLRNHRNLTDAFELSDLIKYSDENACKVAIQLMEKQVRYITKLTILDFAISNFKSIPNKCYTEINRLGLRSKNILVKLQSEFNILYAEKKCIDDLVTMMNFAEVKPNVYYRLVNNLAEFVTYSKNASNIKTYLKRVISSSNNITDSQKKELLSYLRDAKIEQTYKC